MVNRSKQVGILMMLSVVLLMGCGDSRLLDVGHNAVDNAKDGFDRGVEQSKKNVEGTRTKISDGTFFDETIEFMVNIKDNVVEFVQSKRK